MQLSQLVRVLAPLSLLACSGADPDETDLPPPTPCGDSAPVVTDVAIVDNGPVESGGQTYPSLRIPFGATDADGALTAYRILAGYDDDIDDMVDMTDPLVAENSFGPHDCGIGAADLFMDIIVNGDPPPATFLEFGVVLEDADGQASGPPVVVAITSPQ